MSRIGTYVPATRKPDDLGVHSLDHFNLAVPNLQDAIRFYDAFGLTPQERGSKCDLFTVGHSQRWGSIVEGSLKKLQHISFGVFEEDFARFRSKLQSSGIPLLDGPPGFESNGLWFRDPEDTLIEIAIAEKSSPNEKTKFSVPSGLEGQRGAVSRRVAATVQPRRLSHVAMFTSNVDRSIGFYCGVLGLRLSDRSADDVAFLHGIHGSDHHMVAFAKSERPGLHHLSWDVGSIQDIGLGAMQMAGKGFTRGWGLGRHILGSNYFHYVRDPWGSYSEYSADIDYIPADCDWSSDNHPSEDSFYLWGPVPPEDFAFNYEGATC